ncbi:hypothetical protein M2321_002909 [Rhodoblastus acidophilus]|nr:hypothetical protein [Rhodoblastus acidophilus]
MGRDRREGRSNAVEYSADVRRRPRLPKGCRSSQSNADLIVELSALPIDHVNGPELDALEGGFQEWVNIALESWKRT